MAYVKKEKRPTKQIILDTAEKLMQKKPFYTISVDELVEKCGVGKGTFYHYFDSKDDLIQCLSEQSYIFLENKFRSEKKERSYLDRLKQFILDWYQCTNSFSYYEISSQLLFSRLGKYDAGVEKEKSLEFGFDILMECLQGAVECGELKQNTPIRTLAYSIIFTMHGSILHQMKYEPSFNMETWIQDFTITILNTLLDTWREN